MGRAKTRYSCVQTRMKFYTTPHIVHKGIKTVVVRTRKNLQNGEKV